jgi:hypothetical protein
LIKDRSYNNSTFKIILCPWPSLRVLCDLCGEHLSFVAAHHANYGWGNSTLAAIFAFIHHPSSLICSSCPLCLGGECLFFSIVNGPVTHLRRPTNDDRRPRMDSRVRRPSTVLRLTSNVFRLTFLPYLPVLPVIFPLASWCLCGKSFRAGMRFRRIGVSVCRMIYAPGVPGVRGPGCCVRRRVTLTSVTASGLTARSRSVVTQNGGVETVML